MNYLDLFSGCGGFRRGLEEAGYIFEWEGHSEIDKYANQVYEKHYPESEALGDVRTIRTDRLPKINLITFGFPCQDLSIAGSRGGLDWLNVLREVADSGYDGQWQLLNTRWFLPQNRERIYFIGYPRGTSRPQIFPIGESGGGVDKAQRETQGSGERIRSDNPSCAGSLRVGGGDTKDLIANTMSARYYKDGSENLIQRYPLKFLERNQKNVDGDYAFTVDSMNTGGVKISQRGRGKNKGGNKDICPTITGTAFEQNHMVSGIRRLTPTECERLQGFPDGWTARANLENEYITNPLRCAKQEVIAIIVDGEKSYIGSNWCKKPQKVCPRKDGEDYSECKSICNQDNHAEIDALNKVKGKLKNPILYIIGHSRICKDCLTRFKGMPIVFGYPEKIISDTQRYKMMGNAVSVPVVKAVVEKL